MTIQPANQPASLQSVIGNLAGQLTSCIRTKSDHRLTPTTSRYIHTEDRLNRSSSLMSFCAITNYNIIVELVHPSVPSIHWLHQQTAIRQANKAAATRWGKTRPKSNYLLTTNQVWRLRRNQKYINNNLSLIDLIVKSFLASNTHSCAHMLWVLRLFIPLYFNFEVNLAGTPPAGQSMSWTVI